MICCSPNLASSNWRMRVVAEVTCVSCLNEKVRIGCMVCGLAPCWAIILVPEKCGILDRAPVILSSIGIRVTAYKVVASFGPLRWCLRCGTKNARHAGITELGLLCHPILRFIGSRKREICCKGQVLDEFGKRQ